MTRLVVEADGGSRGNPGVAAGGAVVIDPATGAVLSEVGVYVGIATNNVAEYSGLIAGLEAAFERDAAASVARPHGFEARRRADVGPLEGQAPRHAVLADRAQALIAEPRRRRSSGCRGSRTRGRMPRRTRRWTAGRASDVISSADRD